MTANAIFSWKKAQLRREAEGEGKQVSPLILTRARRWPWSPLLIVAAEVPTFRWNNMTDSVTTLLQTLQWLFTKPIQRKHVQAPHCGQHGVA